MTNSDMTCEEFDAALPDYLEGTLDDSLRAAVQKHLSECVRCASLARDLENIRKDAAALPDMAPSRDLWQGIEARIAAPVIPLATRPERQRRLSPAWMGIAAAALIVSTAGITYMLTMRSVDRGSTQVAVVTPPATQTQNGPDSGAAEPSRPPTPTEVGRVNAPQTSAVSRVTRGQPTQRPDAVDARFAAQDLEHSEYVYGKEIEKLQQIVATRKTQLDSSTVVIIERNLQIIDAAIAQSKAALARDPRSRLLGDQLTHALDKKVELLRTAALMPAST
jgi:hypothetical protein